MAHRRLLKNWACEFLPDSCSLGGEALGDKSVPGKPVLTPIAGDAGFREYYRLNAKPTLVAVYAPPDHEDNVSFVNKGLAMGAAGVRVPGIYAVDFQRGFLLLEDLGDALLLPLLDHRSAAGLYAIAESELLKIQQVQADREIFPPYDEERLTAEMALFPRWFIGELLGLELDESERLLIRELFDHLVGSALEQPVVVVHRDYHSRNLLLLKENRMGVVDFQDAVSGPVTYDLVSLLKDCYIRWPGPMVEMRVLAFLESATEAGIISNVGSAQFLRWFDLMGLQRHLKVLGIFARLYKRDGKVRYLDDLPLVIRYTLEAAGRYPSTRAFADWFGERILPVLPGQNWYQPWETAGE